MKTKQKIKTTNLAKDVYWFVTKKKDYEPYIFSNDVFWHHQIVTCNNKRFLHFLNISWNTLLVSTSLKKLSFLLLDTIVKEGKSSFKYEVHIFVIRKDCFCYKIEKKAPNFLLQFYHFLFLIFFFDIFWKIIWIK